MLESQHDWKRFRILLVLGTVLAALAGLTVAFLGGGVWALVVQVPLLGLPAAVDLFVRARWRPDWSWSWPRYRETAGFAINRIGSGAVVRGRLTVEQGVLAGAYNFGALGVFTRSLGLATLVAGRIGTVAMMSLYPVITRAEEGSERFQRIAALVLRGVCWTTIPAAALLALCAERLVALLYGPQWEAVVPLLPLAALVVALAGMTSAVSSLLVANNEVKVPLMIDLAAASLAVGLAIAIAPISIESYLVALGALGAVVLAVTLLALVRKRGIRADGVLQAFLPAAVAGAGATVAVEALRAAGARLDPVAVGLFVEAAVFAAAYLLILRAAFPRALKEMLDVAPGGRRIASSIFWRVP
jgi:O-antigen/teichoic acid export membrane protein